MKTVQVLINSIEQIKDFVNDTGKIKADLDLVSDRYVVNAKSIMGIFSLDLARPVQLYIYAEDGQLEEALTVLEKYILK